VGCRQQFGTGNLKDKEQLNGGTATGFRKLWSGRVGLVPGECGTKWFTLLLAAIGGCGFCRSCIQHFRVLISSIMQGGGADGRGRGRVLYLFLGGKHLARVGV